jgi:hypothetical protein
VPRHVARLVARLVVDYFAYAARLGASARRAAHRLSSTTSPTPRDRVPQHVARLVAWLVAPLVVDYSASRRLIVDYFSYATRPGASARRATRHVARYAARRRLLRLRRASGCLGMSRGLTRLIVDYSVRRDFVLRQRWLYFSHAVRRDYLSRGNTGSTSSTPRAATTSSSGRITSTIHLD